MAEAPAPAPPGVPTAAQLRWDLVLYGTAAYVPACVLLTLLTSGGRQMPRVLLHFLTLPEPITVAMGYGLGYLVVQYRIRNRRPSFLQSQIFAGCVFVGMYLGFAACSVAFSNGPLSHASETAVAAVLVPVKIAAGAVAGAGMYPFLARRRMTGRFSSPTPIPPRHVAPAADPEPRSTPARNRSKRRSRRR
jgi:hypothetical protein